jgi:hypothetical protein
MTSACPCDEHGNVPTDNPPGLERIVARRDDWLSIRRALLERREGEAALADWSPGGTPDRALMIAEWWATLGEILEFYNDEIANEAFLGTAARRESVTRLIAILGYRPRPALAATATLAALVGKVPITLPAGFAVESIPGPGQQPQTFELDADATLQPGGRTLAQPAVRLASPQSGLILLEGSVRTLVTGDRLRLRTPSGDVLLTVSSTTVEANQTRLFYTSTSAIPATATARQCRLERVSQSLGVWTFVGSALVTNNLHLAALTRSVAAGDPVLLSAPGKTAFLSRVTAVTDVIWFANAITDPAANPGDKGLPVPHTRLTLETPPPADWTLAAVSVGVGWVGVAALRDQPPAAWTGTPTTLAAIDPPTFAAQTAWPVLIAETDSNGVPAALSASANAAEASATVNPAYLPGLSLRSPLEILGNLIPVTRGKSVPHEILGSGDARIPGQSFPLAKAPVTYRRNGAAYASSVIMLVDGVPWREVESFYGQPANAAIYTLVEREDGKTLVSFGDGVNGRRLPTGKDNIVARYRYGAGADVPAVGKLTRLPSPWPGLTKILNPVTAGSGADAEPTDQISSYAPRSVLTLGRAVSVADFAAFAASAAAPNRTRAVWAWDETRQRTAITIYVAGGASVLADVRSALAAVGDPHRAVVVGAAYPVPIRLTLGLAIEPGYETAPIIAQATQALVGKAGLFSSARLGVGQPLFTSAISAAIIGIPGVITILTMALSKIVGTGSQPMAGTLHVPDDDTWFDLAPTALSIGCTVNG